MKKSLLVWLIVVCLAGIAVPLYAQEAGLTLKGVSDKVEAIVELVTSMLDRMSTFEQRLAVLEATDTPTPTTTPDRNADADADRTIYSHANANAQFPP